MLICKQFQGASARAFSIKELIPSLSQKSISLGSPLNGDFLTKEPHEMYHQQNHKTTVGAYTCSKISPRYDLLVFIYI